MLPILPSQMRSKLHLHITHNIHIHIVSKLISNITLASYSSYLRCQRPPLHHVLQRRQRQVEAVEMMLGEYSEAQLLIDTDKAVYRKVEVRKRVETYDDIYNIYNTLYIACYIQYVIYMPVTCRLQLGLDQVQQRTLTGTYI